MTILSKAFATLIIAAPVLAFPAFGYAQDTQAEMDAFMAAHHKMMSAMESMKPTGDADKDFVMMMIPHHQGAIDMAEVELKFGKDPMLREMAQQIIDSQREEIEKMQQWQLEHGM